MTALMNGAVNVELTLKCSKYLRLPFLHWDLCYHASHGEPNRYFCPRIVYHVTVTPLIPTISASSADARTDEVELLFTRRFLAGD